MKPRIVTLALGLLGSAALSVSGAFGQQAGNATQGERLAAAVCANCHLVREGQPQPPMDSVPSFAAISRDQAWDEPRLRAFLNRPHYPMPNIELSRRQIDDVIAYLQSRREPGR